MIGVQKSRFWEGGAMWLTWDVALIVVQLACLAILVAAVIASLRASRTRSKN